MLITRSTLLRSTPLALMVMARTVTAQEAFTTLAVEGRTNANPSVAAAGKFVVVAWSGALVKSMDIYLATSNDGGQTFSAPVQVNAVDGDARVNGEMPPRLALVPRRGKTPEIVVVWTAKNATSWAIQSARSVDGGHTFGPATAVPGSDGPGARGWESVAMDDKGHVYAMWLDHRAIVAADAGRPHTMPAAGSAPAPMPKQDPTERAGLSNLYFASLDGSSAQSITNSVCYCCKTSLATAGNNVYAVWRHVYPGSIRDMAFTISTDRGHTFAAPVRISEDHWQIDGCPDNGPAIAVDGKRRAHVVWPTAADPKDASAGLAVFYASSTDGRRFSDRVRVPSRGPAQHAQIVIGGDGAPVVAWDESVEGTRRIGFARVRLDASGAATLSTIAAPDAGPGQWYPALAPTSDGAIAAWVRQAEKGSVIGVGRLR